MSFARAISRGAFLNARFGVKGTQNASRSFGTVATGRVASDIVLLSCGALSERKCSCRYSKPPRQAEWTTTHNSQSDGRVPRRQLMHGPIAAPTIGPQG